MNVLQRLQAGETILGLSNSYPAAGIIEVMCPGWDMVWIDSQHGQHDYNSLLAAIRAADLLGVSTLVRVSTHDPLLLGTYADMDPDALMVPMVETPEQAESIARALRFAPRGNRSYGGRRVIDMHGRNYYQEYKPLIFAQIETLESVDNAEAIAAVEGIDLLFFGPDDMKTRMGIPIDTAPIEHPELREAMRRTAEIARAAGKFAGTVAATPPAVKACHEMGYQVLMCGGDVTLFRLHAPQRLADMKKALEE
jgi:4-hydroxy-2-oxoheptanedioate aldolase